MLYCAAAAGADLEDLKSDVSDVADLDERTKSYADKGLQTKSALLWKSVGGGGKVEDGNRKDGREDKGVRTCKSGMMAPMEQWKQ